MLHLLNFNLEILRPRTHARELNRRIRTREFGRFYPDGLTQRHVNIFSTLPFSHSLSLFGKL